MTQKKMKSMGEMRQESYFSSGNEAYLEGIYESYLENPNSVDAYWKNYFDALQKEMRSGTKDRPHTPVQEGFYEYANSSFRDLSFSGTSMDQRVSELLTAYRRLGHLE